MSTCVRQRSHLLLQGKAYSQHPPSSSHLPCPTTLEIFGLHSRPGRTGTGTRHYLSPSRNGQAQNKLPRLLWAGRRAQRRETEGLILEDPPFREGPAAPSALLLLTGVLPAGPRRETTYTVNHKPGHPFREEEVNRPQPRPYLSSREPPCPPQRRSRKGITSPR